MRTLFYVSLTAIIMAVALIACSKAPAQSESYTIYLVRHADKVLDKSRDPALSPQGQARASALAERLSSEGILGIYSSDYIRTRDTAAPLAERINIDITLYDPRDLAALAEVLMADGRTALVVGHSNTTPQLAERLGANPGPPIIEATEYDRLYKIVLRDGRLITEDILRF
jgi:broad specificity phosphatase PhoE